MGKYSDFYKRIPKDQADNLRYRKDMRQKAARDPALRKLLTLVCREDFLFFLNAFSWLYEPRPRFIEVGGVMRPAPKIFPFITWPHQDDAIKQIEDKVGLCDIGVEKSRGEGLSWIMISMAVRDWALKEGSSIGIVSRNEASADDPDDPSSLFWKIDWQLSRLPIWMVGRQGVDWKRIKDRHTLTNFKMGTSIKADAATGDVFRGGRLTWALFDEFAFFRKGEDTESLASSGGVTDSRVYVSTVNGEANEFFRVMHEPDSPNFTKVIIDWRQNVSRNKGLYKFEGGIPVAVDPVNNPIAPDYDPPSPEVLDLFSRLRRKGYKLEECERSPWYDLQCDRAGNTPQIIAQELDRNYTGSQYLVFGNEFMSAFKRTVLEPFHVGKFDVFEETESGDVDYRVEFQSIEGGEVRLWVPLDVRGRPPKSLYVVAGDVSTGLGGSFTSNSTLVAIDMVTGEQVLGFASNTIEPAQFANMSVGISQWLWGAYLGWEHNGPGSAFTKRIIQVAYGNVFKRKSQSKNARRQLRELGWWTDEKTKTVMFSEFGRAVRAGDITMRDTHLFEECKQYIYEGGRIEHSSAMRTKDGSSKGKAHGDRVIAACVVRQCMLDRPHVSFSDISQPLNRGPGSASHPDTMAARMQMYQEEDSKVQDDGDGWHGSVQDKPSPLGQYF